MAGVSERMSIYNQICLEVFVLPTMLQNLLFSCLGSSLPYPWLKLRWLTANLEFGHTEWLLRLETLYTFDQGDVWTKRQKDKKTKRQKESLILWCQGNFALLQCFYGLGSMKNWNFCPRKYRLPRTVSEYWKSFKTNYSTNYCSWTFIDSLVSLS